MSEPRLIPRRGPKAAARRERTLREFERSGLSAHAFAHQRSVPYTTLIHWLKQANPVPKRIAFTEVNLPTAPPEPLTLELGPHTRIRLTASSQLPLAVQLIKLLQA